MLYKILKKIINFIGGNLSCVNVDFDVDVAYVNVCQLEGGKKETNFGQRKL